MPIKEEGAARARAARGYAGLKQDALAQKLQMSVETLSRIENGHRRLTTDEARQISEICDVPLPFMEHGWTAVAGEDAPAAALTRRVAALEAELQRLETIEAALRTLSEIVEDRLGQLSTQALEPGTAPGSTVGPLEAT